MDFALLPKTAPGSRFISLAEEHAADFATRADRHDREGSFPFENIEAMQRSEVMAACVPAELGGMGVKSLSTTPLRSRGRLNGDRYSNACIDYVDAHSRLASCDRRWRRAAGRAHSLLASRDRRRQTSVVSRNWNCKIGCSRLGVLLPRPACGERAGVRGKLLRWTPEGVWG